MIVDAFYRLVEEAAGQGWLPGPFAHRFMLRALLAGLLLAPLLGALSPVVMVHRLAFFSSALGNAALTGVALGIALGEPASAPWAGMFGFSLLAALAMTWVRHHSGLPADTVVGVFLALTLGLGVCLLALATRRFDIHQVEGAMFGNILILGDGDLVLALGVAVLAWGWLVARGNRVLVAGIDPALARARGIDPRRLDYQLMAVLAVVLVASLHLVGFLLVEGLVLVPAAAARNLTTTHRGQVAASVAIALLATEGGILLSYLLPVPSGAAITLLLAALFFLTLLPSRRSP